jgi:hypothetical protein
MIVGAVGLLMSLLWMTMWRGQRGARPARGGYVERDVPPADTY